MLWAAGGPKQTNKREVCATCSSRPASADGRVVSTADVLAACGIDPASPCAGMMTYQWPDFGIPPTEQPFFLYACKVAYHCEVVIEW